MTYWYSMTAVCHRVLATFESTAAAALKQAIHGPQARSIFFQGSRPPMRTSFSQACDRLRLDYIRTLKRKPRRHHLPHLNFDLAREGYDFSIWKIEISGTLPRTQYESMRQMVEHELNTQASADLQLGATLRRLNRQDTHTGTRLSQDQQTRLIQVIAMWDTDVEDEVPTACSLFFSYPVDAAPTAMFSMLRSSDERFLTMSKTVPVLDALRSAGFPATLDSAPTPTNTKG